MNKPQKNIVDSVSVRQPLRIRKFIQSLFYMFFLFQLPACLAGNEYFKVPFSKKINISEPSIRAQMLVHIGKEGNYAFSLRFKHKNTNEGDRVLDLMEGKDTYGRSTNGEKTPIGIDVYMLKDDQTILVSVGGGESFPFYASGMGYFEKLIYTAYLMPGDYRVVVESKEGNQKFKDVEVEVHVGTAHKPK